MSGKPLPIALQLGATLEFYREKGVFTAGLKPGEVAGSPILNLSLVKPNGTVFAGLAAESLTLKPISFVSPQPSLPAIAIDTPQPAGDGFFLVPCLRIDTPQHQWVIGNYAFGLRVRILDAGNLFFAQTVLRLQVA
ncbi:MAG: hypothetical protein ACTHOH_04695 [Lysobacteraceae bacterium]